jgi:phosphoribosylglycinamide formyltransferase-1
MARVKVAVLVSGRGSNLQALVDACRAPDFPAEIALVFSNKGDAPALARASAAGIATDTLSHKGFAERELYDREVDRRLAAAGVRYVLLAGYMRLFSSWFVERWRDRMLNIHPSLLPSFKGLNVQQAALDAGVAVAGCTVHFTRLDMDAGPIVAQAAVPVCAGDDAEVLSARILAAEHKLYPLALRWLAEGRLSVVEEKVVVAGTSASARALWFDA